MKKHIIITIAILTALAATPAFATKPGNNGGGNGGCGVGQQTNGCSGTTTPPASNGGQGGAGGNGGAGGQGGTGGQGGAGGIGQGGTGGAGGSVLGSGNSSNRNDNTNTNAQGQAQGQLQGQLQGQAQGQVANGGSARSNSGGNTLSNGSSSSSGASSTSSSGGNTLTGGTQSATQANAVTVNGDTVTYQAQQRDPVASAWAAPLTSGSNTCMGSSSGGAQGVTFGVSFGTAWQDDNCNARYDAQALNSLGLRPAAIARLCQRSDNAKAIEAAGGKCPSASEKQANALAEPAVASASSNYVN